MKTLIAVLVLLVAYAAVIFFRRRRANGKPEFSEEEHNRCYEGKKAALERILGPMHDFVGHAIFPFQVGGAVDMYYFSKGIPGTGFATMELIEPDGSGPKPNRIGTYELAAFTKHTIPDITKERDEKHPFNKIERRICGIFTKTGFYSQQAVLNPGETCEIPGKEGEPNICLILDEYSLNGIPFEIAGKRHCLLLCLEVFRSEMEYSREHGSDVALKKLKELGHYPYSDLDREPVF